MDTKAKKDTPNVFELLALSPTCSKPHQLSTQNVHPWNIKTNQWNWERVRDYDGGKRGGKLYIFDELEVDLIWLFLRLI